MKKKKMPVGRIINTAILLLIGFVTIYPFIYILSTSLSSSNALMTQRVFLLPKDFSLATYKFMLTNKDLWVGFKNSLIYTAVGTFCCTFAVMMTAYPAAQKGDFKKYSNPFMKLVVFTMYFSGGMIPTYLLVKQLGLINTMWSIFLPTLITPFQLILAKTFIEDIPEALGESAKIDGANEIQIFFSIIIPLCKPIIAVLALYNLTGVWNEFKAAMLYLNSQDKYPLQIYIREIVLKAQMVDKSMFSNTSGLNSETIKSATLVISTLPVLIIYPMIQKYLVGGIMVGAIKG